MRTPLTELASGFRKRTLATAKLAAKLGVRYAKHAVGASPAASVSIGQVHRASCIRDFARAPSSARDRGGEIVFATCFDTLMGACVYNGDPHPGNSLFAAAAGVTSRSR